MCRLLLTLSPFSARFMSSEIFFSFDVSCFWKLLRVTVCASTSSSRTSDLEASESASEPIAVSVELSYLQEGQIKKGDEVSVLKAERCG